MSSTREIQAIADQVVHITSTFDPSTRLPLVVIDSSEFPVLTSDLYASVVSAVMAKLPQSNYALLFFACGAPNKPSWSWVAKTYSMLDNDFKKRVKKVYVVHESWWVRAITEMLRGVVSTKFKRKVVHVSNLSQLAQLIDITVIDIKPKVYLHNQKIENEITIPRHPMPVFGMPLMIDGLSNDIIIPRVWTEGIEYLHKNGYLVCDLFKKSENSSQRNDHTFATLQIILRDCYDRNQLINLHDYGPRIMASLLRLYIYQLPTPILTDSTIRMFNNGDDTPQHCINIFRSLNIESQILLADLIDLLSFLVHPTNSTRPSNTSGSLAACIGPSFLGNTNGDSTNIVSAVRFTKLLIEYWSQISTQASRRFTNRITSQDIPRSPQKPLRSISSFSSSSSETTATCIPMTRLRTYPSVPSFNNNYPFTEIRQDSRSSSVSSTTTASSSSSDTQQRPKIPTTSAPPPPIPRKLKLQLTSRTTVSPSSTTSPTILQPTNKSNIISTKSPTVPYLAKPIPLPAPPSPTDPNANSIKRSGPRPRTVIRRGKMVAELAKLYEEKCHTADILMKIDNQHNHS